MGACAPLPVAVSRLASTFHLGFGRGVNEGAGVSVLPQDLSEMVLFLPQVVLHGGDGSGSVKQAPDSPLLIWGGRWEWKSRSRCVGFL